MWVEPILAEKQAAMAELSHEQSTVLLLKLLTDTIIELQTSLCWLSTHALGDLVFTVASNDANAAEFLTHCLLPADLKTPTAPHLQIFVCTGSVAPFISPPSWNLPHTDQRHQERLHLTPDGKVSALYDHARDCWM